MHGFSPHTPDSAPAEARDTLESVRKAYGFVPNLIANMVEAPATAKGYLALSSLLDETSLSPTEQQIVLLATSRFNECEYCVAAHSAIARRQNVDAGIVAAIRNDEPLDDSRLEALRRFVVAVNEKRGWLDDADVGAFLDAGYDRRRILEVLLGVGMKTISNYTNHIAGTPLDEAFADEAWAAGKHAAA